MGNDAKNKVIAIDRADLLEDLALAFLIVCYLHWSAVEHEREVEAVTSSAAKDAITSAAQKLFYSEEDWIEATAVAAGATRRALSKYGKLDDEARDRFNRMGEAFMKEIAERQTPTN